MNGIAEGTGTPGCVRPGPWSTAPQHTLQTRKMTRARYGRRMWQRVRTTCDDQGLPTALALCHHHTPKHRWKRVPTPSTPPDPSSEPGLVFVRVLQVLLGQTRIQQRGARYQGQAKTTPTTLAWSEQNTGKSQHNLAPLQGVRSLGAAQVGDP